MYSWLGLSYKNTFLNITFLQYYRRISFDQIKKMMHHFIRKLALMVILFPLSIAEGCNRTCGGMDVPYPFGLLQDGSDCYFNLSYAVNCSGNSPILNLGYTSITISSISLADHELRTLVFSSRVCYTSSSERSFYDGALLRSPHFPISTDKNTFIAIGCDTVAVFSNALDFNYGDKSRTGCLTACTDLNSVVNGSCSGVGCCKTYIPENAYSYNISISSFNNHRDADVTKFNNCSYAFAAADDWFNFSAGYLSNFTNESVPLVLDWSVGDGTCKEAKKNTKSYMCKGNSTCSDAGNGRGYRCRCWDGYGGNPYLSDEGGCQDIDECSTVMPCAAKAICVNTIGNFSCLCPRGYYGNGLKYGYYGDGSKNGFYGDGSKMGFYGGGRKYGSGCTPNSRGVKKSIAIASGTTSGIGVLLLIILGWWLHKIIKKRQETKLKKKYFEQNGGLLLQQQLHFNEGTIMDKGKVFTSEELDRATDHFNANRILGQGGQGTVYKGMLIDGSIVAIKKSKIEDQTKLQQFINEVVILSRISHRNIVKLLGCCLETEVPLLVYEFVPNGTLYQYLHNPTEEFILSWDIRLKISTEIAEALSYLHFTAAIPIYHRDIKTSNILLDEKYRAKIADFGTSKTIAIDQTHATTMVQGTFGYLDPEYFQSSQFTDKSDVYSFGIVLVELLTGQRAICSSRENEVKSLATYFIHSLANDYFLDIVDPKLLKEGVTKEITMVANLAKRCLSLNGKNRPSMKEIAMELEGLRRPRALDLEKAKRVESEYEGIFELPDVWDVESYKATSSSTDQPLLSIKTM